MEGRSSAARYGLPWQAKPEEAQQQPGRFSPTASASAGGLDRPAPPSGELSRAVNRVGRSFDLVTLAANQQIGENLLTVFRLADVWQRGVVDLTFSATALDGAGILHAATELVQPMFAVLDLLAPGSDTEASAQELANKLELLDLVRNAESWLGLSPRAQTNLARRIERAYGLGPFLALWGVETVGIDYATRQLQGAGLPSRLLRTGEGGEAPPATLTMLHAGMGLGFAQKLFEPLGPGASAGRIRATLEQFVQLCRNNSRPGYGGAALEALGLVIYRFHRALVGAVDTHLSEIQGDLPAYFWHGLGRAVYLSSEYVLPWKRIDWRTVADIAPHQVGRRNLVAGLAWAITLINMRHPRVLESLLRHHGAALTDDDAFANGVASSLLVRYDTTPDAVFLATFCQYGQSLRDPRLAALWTNEVERLCRQAIIHLHPRLQREQRFEKVFRYQPYIGKAAGGWDETPRARRAGC